MPRTTAAAPAVDLIAAVRAHATENYANGEGWDYVVEAWGDDDVTTAIGAARSVNGAIKKVREALVPLVERDQEAQAAAAPETPAPVVDETPAVDPTVALTALAEEVRDATGLEGVTVELAPNGKQAKLIAMVDGKPKPIAYIVRKKDGKISVEVAHRGSYERLVANNVPAAGKLVKKSGRLVPKPAAETTPETAPAVETTSVEVAA